MAVDIERIYTGTKFSWGSSRACGVSVDVRGSRGQRHSGFSSKLRKHQLHLLLRNCPTVPAIRANLDIVNCIPGGLRKSDIYRCPNPWVTDSIYAVIPCIEGQSQRLQRGEGRARQEMGNGKDEGIVFWRTKYYHSEAERYEVGEMEQGRCCRFIST